ncbi:MAG: tetratricopeptide repeat protein [Microscillaceae bacterium]|jgi:tetratricopeptide (TPR) repeat protein|nr:tetratricopeptide repeat protein [Microscillaceae bacterium]
MKNSKWIIFALLLSLITWVFAQSANELLQKGNDKMKRGDYGGAIKDLNDAIKENPNLSEAYQKRGKSKRKLGNINGALEDYNTALRINANLSNSYLGRAQVNIQLGNYEAAIGDYNIFLQNNPNSPHTTAVLYNRALAKNKLKDIDGALADYELVLKNQPDNPKALVNRALIRYNRNEIRPACADWLRAKKLGNEKAAQNADKACQCCM